MAQLHSRRQFLKFSAITASTLALAACAVPVAPAGGGATTTTTEGAAAAPAAAANAVRYHARVGTQGDYFTQMAEAFHAEGSGSTVAVELIPGTGTEYLQKVATMVAGGTIGDAMWTASIDNFYSYAAANLFAGLDQFVDAEGYDLSVFYPVAIDSCRYNDALYGMPWVVHPGRVGLYYNRNAFQDAGLEEPSADWTYDDLTAAGQALTVREGDRVTQWGFLPETDYFGLVIPIRSEGGDWINPEGTQATIGEPGGVAGLELWEGYYQDIGISPIPSSVSDKPQMWASGDVVMIQSGYWGQSWGQNYVKDFEWAVAPMPQGAAGTRSMFEFDPNVILASSALQAQAWEWLKYVSTKEAGVKIAEMGSVPGGRPDVWEDERLTAKPAHVVFAEVMKTIDPLVLPANHRSQELFQVAKNLLDPIWLGEGKVADVIGSLTSEMQAVLDMPPI